MEIEILKSGRYAFDGVTVKNVTAGPADLPDDWAKQLIAHDWAKVASAPVAAPQTEPAQTPDEPTPQYDDEHAELLAMDGDKDALDAYAAGLGVKLDKRKGIDKMLADLLAAVK
jgi:hypothetical protein